MTWEAPSGSSGVRSAISASVEAPFWGRGPGAGRGTGRETGKPFEAGGGGSDSARAEGPASLGGRSTCIQSTTQSRGRGGERGMDSEAMHKRVCSTSLGQVLPCPREGRPDLALSSSAPHACSLTLSTAATNYFQTDLSHATPSACSPLPVGARPSIEPLPSCCASSRPQQQPSTSQKVIHPPLSTFCRLSPDSHPRAAHAESFAQTANFGDGLGATSADGA